MTAIPELVLLLDEPLAFEVEFLQRAALSAFGHSLSTDEPEAGEFVTGEFPIFFVQIEGRLLQVKSMFLPYFDPEVREFVSGDLEALLKSIDDPMLKLAVGRHKGWISVRLMNPEVEERKSLRYRFVSRLLSAFAFEEIPAIIWPEENRLLSWDFEMQDVLHKGKGLSLFR